MIALGTVCFGECMCDKRRQALKQCTHRHDEVVASKSGRQGAVILAILLGSGSSEAEVAIVAVWDHAGDANLFDGDGIWL